MPASIGVNLRVTGHCRQGDRKYMEDYFSVAYQQTEDERDLEYAFFGIFDGHGGCEAAAFAKEHLMEMIVKQRSFWSDHDDDVLRAIKEGYLATHFAMWREQDKWPKTQLGLPSTAGTTASVAFIRRRKIYIGHVGDSAIVLGMQTTDGEWYAKQLTHDHKPENADEMERIQGCGGKVVSKSGVPRVVWNRPKVVDPQKRPTPIRSTDEIPFLAVARSLGDLWSYNAKLHQFVVSPQPDCCVIDIDTSQHKCLIFGTDGLFNMLTAQAAVNIVQTTEHNNEMTALDTTILSNNNNNSDEDEEGGATTCWTNPSKALVEKALERWQHTKLRADNTSVITLLLDPPGPPRAQVLKQLQSAPPPPPPIQDTVVEKPPPPLKKDVATSGLKIVTRYQTPEVDTNPNNSQKEAADNRDDPSIQINEVSSSSCNENKRDLRRRKTSSLPIQQRSETTNKDAAKSGGGVRKKYRKLQKTKKTLMALMKRSGGGGETTVVPSVSQRSKYFQRGVGGRSTVRRRQPSKYNHRNNNNNNNSNINNNNTTTTPGPNINKKKEGATAETVPMLTRSKSRRHQSTVNK